jgi:hypothetical protein
LIIK